MRRSRSHAIAFLLGVFAVSVPCLSAQLPPGTQDTTNSARQANTAANSDAQSIQDAEQALERGDAAAAQTKLQMLVAKHPANAQMQYDLGYAAEENHDSSTARKAYSAAIVADPSAAEAYVALGLLEAREGSGDDGAANLHKGAALVGGPPDVRARAYRALAALDEVRNPAAARDELAAAIQLTGEMPGDILMSAEMAQRTGDFVDAETAYRRAETHADTEAEATTGLARTLRAEKKFVDAQAVLNAALLRHPNDPSLSAELALVESEMGDPRAAAQQLTQLRASDSVAAANSNLTRETARLDAQSGDYAASAALYQELLKTNASDPTLLDEYGSVLVKAQHYAEAQSVLARAFAARDAFPTPAAWAEVAGHLAFAASKNHDPAVTLQALAARATVLPNTAATLFLESTAHDTLHQYKDAAASYRAFLAIADEKNYSNERFEARHRLIALEHMK